MRVVGLSLCFALAVIVVGCGGSDGGGKGDGVVAGASGEATQEMPEGGGPASEAGGEGGGGTGTGGKGNPPVGGEGGETVIGVVSHGSPRTGYGNVVDGVVARSKNFTVILSVGEEP